MDASKAYLLKDHIGFLATVLEWSVSFVELFAICILLLGLARFIGAFVSGEIFQRDSIQRTHELNTGRLQLARHILAALEVFIISDIIRTVLAPTMDNLMFLGLLVLIRSAISFILEREMRNLEREEGIGRVCD